MRNRLFLTMTVFLIFILSTTMAWSQSSKKRNNQDYDISGLERERNNIKRDLARQADTKRLKKAVKEVRAYYGLRYNFEDELRTAVEKRMRSVNLRPPAPYNEYEESWSQYQMRVDRYEMEKERLYEEIRDSERRRLDRKLDELRWRMRDYRDKTYQLDPGDMSFRLGNFREGRGNLPVRVNFDRKDYLPRGDLRGELDMNPSEGRLFSQHRKLLVAKMKVEISERGEVVPSRLTFISPTGRKYRCRHMDFDSNWRPEYSSSGGYDPGYNQGYSPSNPSSGGYSTGGVNPGAASCFIATAAFGSPWQEDVATLRDFRDQYLLTSEAGRALVRAYYRTSPPIAREIAERPWARGVVRIALTPFVVVAGAMLGGIQDILLIFLSLSALCCAVHICGTHRKCQEGRGIDQS